MTILYVLVPVALGMGLVALASFLWSLGASQYEDLSGAAERILLDIDREPLPRVTGPALPRDPKETT